MAAATTTLPAILTLEEYLHTAYHPDCDFVDGILEEREALYSPDISRCLVFFKWPRLACSSFG
jgi:hypothetical protein